VTADLRDLYAAAWLEGMQQRPQIAPTDPATRIRLDDTGRPPTVPLRPTGGHRG
jgi:hypothetical protein